MNYIKQFGLFQQNSRLALFTAQWDFGTQRDHFGQIELFEEMEQLCEVLQGRCVSAEKKKIFHKQTNLTNLGKLEPRIQTEGIRWKLFAETFLGKWSNFVEGHLFLAGAEVFGLMIDLTASFLCKEGVSQTTSCCYQMIIDSDERNRKENRNDFDPIYITSK